MNLTRIKRHEAIKYLGLCDDSFREWCTAVQIVAYKYEFSSRQYFLRGEFLAKADSKLIQRLQEIHGENWGRNYPHYNDVKGFLGIDTILEEPYIPVFTPTYTDTNSFLTRLRK